MRIDHFVIICGVDYSSASPLHLLGVKWALIGTREGEAMNRIMSGFAVALVGVMVMVETAEDVDCKIKFSRRARNGHLNIPTRPALAAVVDHISSIAEKHSN